MDNEKQSIIHMKEAGLLLSLTPAGYYEPIAYDVKEEVGGSISGIEIKKGDIFYDFILYMTHSITTFNINTKSNVVGYIELYQWWIAFRIIKNAKELKSEDVSVVISRQSGKSHQSRSTLAFILVFLPTFIKLKHERYYVTFTNYKKDAVQGQLDKLLPFLRKAVDIFNKMYPNEPIEWAETKSNIEKKLLGNTECYQFNKVINGKSVPYSQMDILSLNAKVKNCGITSHLLYADESQELDYNSVSESVIPALASTGGCVVTIGTANNSPETMLYHYYHSSIVKKENNIVLDWEKVYNYKLHISKERAQIYKTHVEKQIEDKGKFHEIIQTQYYVNFNLTNNKLVSMEKLKNNQILTGNIETNIKEYRQGNIYRVGSVDLAITGDRSVMMIGIASFLAENRVKSNLKDIIILKELGDSLSIEKQAVKICDECIANNIDFLMFDTTSQQQDNVMKVYKVLKERNCKTQIVNFSFSGDNKSTMFYSLENAFYEGNIILPSLDYVEKHKAYKLLLYELCSLKKIKKRDGSYTYEAPSDDIHDDTAMCFAMFNYVLIQTMKKIGKREAVRLIDIQYYLTLRKYPEENSESEQKHNLTQWLDMW